MADSAGCDTAADPVIPLWPIALIASLAADPSHPIRRSTLLGNRMAMTRRVEFTARQFSASLPILRYLPYLFSVAAGHLRLVGVEPLAPAAAAARTEEWEFVRDEAPAGLFGPVQLTLLSGCSTGRAPADGGVLCAHALARERFEMAGARRGFDPPARVL